MVKYEGFLYAAYKDILAIEALMTDIDLHCEVISFHAQQASEKILKNIFDVNGIIPDKTHHLDELIAKAIDNNWLSASQDEIRAAVHLSYYAVSARYVDTPDIDRGEALKAIYDCNKIADMVERNGYQAIKIDVKVDLLRNQALAPEKEKDNHTLNQPSLDKKEVSAREGAEHHGHDGGVKPDINKDDR